MELVKINQQLVRPIPSEKVEENKIRGYELFPEVYANIFLCAKKKSGKTSTIFKIIKQCADPETQIYIFCPTYVKDQNWIAIKDWLTEHQYHAMFFDSIMQSGVNMIQAILDLEKKEAEAEKAAELIEKVDKETTSENFYCLQHCVFEEKTVSFKIKKPKKTKLTPKIMFVFDDISNELKDNYIATLLKTNRHYKSKVIISSQYPNDLKPESRKQLDYWLLFKGHSKEKLESIYSLADLNVPFEDFEKIYELATEEPFNFLYIDTTNCTFRKNFNYEIKYK